MLMKLTVFSAFLALSLSSPQTRAEDSFELSIDSDGSGSLFQDAWNECSGPITGNYSGYGCAGKRQMDSEFEQFLRESFLRCASSGLQRIGGGEARKAHLIHNGVFADPRHSKKSLHAVGRAIDIQQLRLVLADGRSRSFDFRVTSSQPRGNDRLFFEGFRACWQGLHLRRGCDRLPSGNPVGTIGWEDNSHRGHHLHVSMPFCPNPRGFFRTGEGLDGEEELGVEDNQ